MNDSRGYEPVVVGVFADQADAQLAVRELVAAGFTEERIGVVARAAEGAVTQESAVAAGTVAGAVTGAGIGSLWALGIAAGMLPAIGPVIAGGILGSLLASAGVGAAAGGVAGALIGLGLPAEEAEQYHAEFEAGKSLVTVRDGGRQAASIMRNCGGTVRDDWPMRGENPTF